MTALKIDIQAGAVTAALNRLAAAGQDLTPAMQAIAGVLARQTEDNFSAESGPLGKWPAVKDKKRRAGKILQDKGRLAGSVTPFWSATEAGIGTNVVYAAIHQLGGDIERAAYSGWVRLRTNAAGELLRQGGKGHLAVFAKNSHKRAKSVRYTTSGHSIHIPARPYLPGTAAGLQAGVEDAIVAELARFIGQAVG